MTIAQAAQHAASLTDASADWPTIAEAARVLTLRAGFNPAVVLAGTTLLGIAAGVVGAFALLRKRALMSDALTHATLPGVALAYLVATAIGIEGRTLWILLIGAAATGVLGLIAVQVMVRKTRLSEDTAIGVVLSVFFGAGIVLLSLIQGMETGNQGGLKSFIYGQTAAMHASDAMLMGVIALIAVIGAAALFKELTIVCFNDAFAKVGGWPVTAIDLLMMGMVVLVVVAGLQAVGLILVVAMLIIPPAAARFWTDRLGLMVALSGFIGGISGYLGATMSSLLPRMPAGAVIVLTAGAVFVLSLLLAPNRGVLAAAVQRFSLTFRVSRDHVLRAMHDQEASGTAGASIAALKAHSGIALSWWIVVMLHLFRLTGLVERSESGWRLTETGRATGARLTRNHRLWEQYLVHHADVAPSHVDWSADTVEHVLSPELIEELERTLAAERAGTGGSP